MKLNKEQTQKAALAVLLGIGSLYYYTFEMLGPLKKREAMALTGIAALEPKLKEANAKITRTNAIKSGDKNAAEAERLYAIMKARIPGGQPVAWLPTRFGEFFKEQGIGKPTFRCNADSPESDFPGYKSTSWTLEFPSIGFAALGGILSGLENQEGLMQITNLQIDTMGGDPEIHRVLLTFSTLVKSEK